MSEESPVPRLRSQTHNGRTGPNEESEGSPSQISHLNKSEPSCRRAWGTRRRGPSKSKILSVTWERREGRWGEKESVLLPGDRPLEWELCNYGIRLDSLAGNDGCIASEQGARPYQSTDGEYYRCYERGRWSVHLCPDRRILRRRGVLWCCNGEGRGAAIQPP